MSFFNLLFTVINSKQMLSFGRQKKKKKKKAFLGDHKGMKEYMVVFVLRMLFPTGFLLYSAVRRARFFLCRSDFFELGFC